MLNSENLLAESGLEPHSTPYTADKILYNYAIEQCQAAALDELFGNPEECFQVLRKYISTIPAFFTIDFFSFQRYHGAHVLLHALQFQTQSEEDKKSLAHYKDAVEKRLHILEQQGYVQAFETTSYWDFVVPKSLTITAQRNTHKMRFARFLSSISSLAPL